MPCAHAQEGLANICLVGSSTTVVRAKIEVNLPRKRGAAAAGFDKAWTKFMDAVFAAVIRHVDFSVVKCLVIAVGGWVVGSWVFRALIPSIVSQKAAAPLSSSQDQCPTVPSHLAFMTFTCVTV